MGSLWCGGEGVQLVRTVYWLRPPRSVAAARAYSAVREAGTAKSSRSPRPAAYSRLKLYINSVFAAMYRATSRITPNLSRNGGRSNLSRFNTSTLSLGNTIPVETQPGMTFLHSIVLLLGSASSTRDVLATCTLRVHFCSMVLSVQCTILLEHGLKGLRVQAHEPS